MAYRTPIDKNDKKEVLLYRIVRIVMTLAMVLIVGYMVTHVNDSTSSAGASTNQTEAVSKNDDAELAENTKVNEIENTEVNEIDDTVVAQSDETIDVVQSVSIIYRFRNDNLLNQHFEKHGMDMGFETAKEYEAAASEVVNNPNALHKIEAEDGDDVYYIEDTNEFVVVSTDGYIRTYFNPDSGKKYFDKQ